MSTISIQFPNPINSSVQVGDLMYFTDPTADYQSSGFSVDNGIFIIGEIGSITVGTNNTTIVCGMNENNPQPTQDSFLFFSKDNKANTSSIRGYYNEVTFKNNSIKPAELFAASCEVAESSK